MNEVTFTRGLESLDGKSPANTAKTGIAQNQETFGNMLARSLDDVNQLKLKADEAVGNLVAGRQKDIHATMIALEKADIAFQLLMQIRNKIISAYETVMRTQV
ncbi:MAG: flagellar hook-basal body complex protein FliE [Deltaproteobacteria bacterium]|jgi:flagellar hook-basal body complex protein FliE